MYKIYILFALFFACDAQKVSFGNCPVVTVQQNFNVTRYLGKWYEYEKFLNFFQITGKCVTATYTDNGDGKIKVFNKQYNILTNAEESITGSAVLQDNSGEAKLLVTFPTSGPVGGAPYWILETDYDNYAVVYSCGSAGKFKIEFAWILTRQQRPMQRYINRAENVLASNFINVLHLATTLQYTCPIDE